jgi:hypothetical protein
MYHPALMSAPPHPRPARPGGHPAWLVALWAVVTWQAWLTLGLFGPAPWAALLDDRPVLSGRHPLHLYHGLLGARALHRQGTLSCYDPSFHAGYPKTPVFDPGSRPAELFLTLAGGTYSPAAYKLGHALAWALAPLLVFTAARAVGLARGSAVLAALLGLLVWWGQPARDALEAGNVDLLLAALLVLAQTGLLLRYHRAPGLLPLTGVVLTNLLGWFTHPLLMALFFPLFLLYYFSAGTRHRLLWHTALWIGLLVALAGNSFWLADWIDYWWIRAPGSLDPAGPMLPRHTLRAFWESPLWGGPIDRLLTCLLVVAAAAGVLLYHRPPRTAEDSPPSPGGRGRTSPLVPRWSRRHAGRILGLGWTGLLALALIGSFWEPLGRLGASRLLAPALLFACLPAAHALAEAARLLRRWPGPVATATLAVGLALTVGLLAPPPLRAWARRLTEARPLQLGLDAREEELVAALRKETTAEARILWEDRQEDRTGSRWTALLPLWTGRAFIGGLDPSSNIEHTAGGLRDGALAGRPLTRWSDGDLARYCDRYNVGWVVCRSPGTRERFGEWTGCQRVRELPGRERPALYRVLRKPSFALAGRAEWRSADSYGVVLADVVPGPAKDGGPEGQVVLSLHYQEGMRVTPSRVRLERDETYSPDDIPFVRLRMADPVARVTITWEIP